MGTIHIRTSFTHRVTYYNRYRPSYPEALYQYLEEALGLRPEHTIADIGAGTGFASNWFACNGNPTYAVEPDMEMRQAAAWNYQSYPNYHVLAGTAEDTPLPDHSIDFVISGQAFDWFKQKEAAKEIRRILKPGGYVLLVWNERRTDSSPFLRQLENLLLRHVPAYAGQQKDAGESDAIASFYGTSNYGYETFDNCQVLNWEGLKGRLLSTSFMPDDSQPEYHNLLKSLHRGFRAHAIGGQVKVDYVTKLYYGQPV